MMPATNVKNLGLGQSLISGLLESLKVMYNPATGTLLACPKGNHAELHVQYANGESYDDFVKIWVGRGCCVIRLDRHRASSDEEAWHKAFDAIEALREAGMPAEYAISFEGQNKDGVSV